MTNGTRDRRSYSLAATSRSRSTATRRAGRRCPDRCGPEGKPACGAASSKPGSAQRSVPTGCEALTRRREWPGHYDWREGASSSARPSHKATSSATPGARHVLRVGAEHELLGRRVAGGGNARPAGLAGPKRSRPCGDAAAGRRGGAGPAAVAPPRPADRAGARVEVDELNGRAPSIQAANCGGLIPTSAPGLRLHGYRIRD